jgi:hypothetical protein
MLRTTAHQQLRRTNPAKGYVAGRCNASTVVVTSDLGARPDKARLLHPPLWPDAASILIDGREVLAGRKLGIKEVDEGIWLVSSPRLCRRA